MAVCKSELEVDFGRDGEHEDRSLKQRPRSLSGIENKIRWTKTPDRWSKTKIVKHMRLWLFECKEPSHEAFTLGLAAAALLVLAHVLASLIGGCSFCTQEDIQKASPSRQCSLLCLLLTWVVLGVGLGLLVIGTLSNNKSRASCGLTHHHYLSLGGSLCFVHAGFSVGYYVIATASPTE
ncbi:protein VASCULATURE COMPLEXITY AND CONNECTIVITY-like [Diospyros lotus]|uniref:protein VASCULATURE COMPLEXITY AND CONNECTIVITY-like n=1 Tax=Diospyros lotus TaxID=55363 RepID=UPI00225572A7|nr:protein VASCULATURE COMPLEXITY AND CONNECTIVITY-like [Diospyros lotus]